MQLKTSTIICLFIVTWIFIIIVMFGGENKVNDVNHEIAIGYATQSMLSEEISQVSEANVELAERADEIEYENTLQGVRLALHRQMLDDMTEDVDMLNNYLPTPTPIPTHAISVSVSEADIRNIAALVYLEAGSQSYRCQQAIATVIFNRMMRYHKTANQVIYESGVFSPASRVASTTPSASCLDAVRSVLSGGGTLPSNVLAFRNGHYHSFGRNYCCIDGVYFTAM